MRPHQGLEPTAVWNCSAVSLFRKITIKRLKLEMNLIAAVAVIVNNPVLVRNSAFEFRNNISSYTVHNEFNGICIKQVRKRIIDASFTPVKHLQSTVWHNFKKVLSLVDLSCRCQELRVVAEGFTVPQCLFLRVTVIPRQILKYAYHASIWVLVG